MRRLRVPLMWGGISAIPVGIGPTKRRCGGWIGTKVQQHERRRSPMRPRFCAGDGSDESPQPCRCGARNSHSLIARTRDNRNRNHCRNPPPVAPAVELAEIIRAHDPNEPPFGITANQIGECVGCKARAHLGFDVRRFDDAPPRHFPRRSEAGREGGHAFNWFQRIARRHQPPDVIQPQRVSDKQADPPMPAMRRIK